MSSHVTPVGNYALVFLALLVLLAATVWVAYLPLGVFGPIAAMTIAVLKGTLIMLFFMHLVHEEGLTRVFAVSGLVWLILLFVFLLGDYFTRDNVEQAGGAKVSVAEHRH